MHYLIQSIVIRSVPYLLTYLLVSVTTCFANDSISFHHVGERLSQSTISRIIQDNEGFLWFGTRYGLNKYDGKSFKAYLHNPNDSNSLSDSRINDIISDENGNFWIATDEGVNHFKVNTGTFSHLQHDPTNPNSISSDFTLSLFWDHKGVLWIGTENKGLNTYDPSTNRISRFIHNADDPFSISNNHIWDITEDPNGNIWIGTQNGLNLYDRNTRRFIHYNTDNVNSFKSNSIRTLLSSNRGIFVGSQQGLLLLQYNTNGKYDFKSIPEQIDHGEKQVLSNANILTLMEDNNKELWVGTENKGLFHLNRDLNRMEVYRHIPSDPTSLSSNSIWSLFQDRTDIIWVGTFNRGLDKIDMNHWKFEHYDDNPLLKYSVSYNTVSSFVEEGDGLWIGTDGGGLNFLDNQTGESRVYRYDPLDPTSLAGDAVLSMIKDQRENIWIASWEGGVSLKRKGADQFERFQHEPNNPNSISGRDAFYLFEDTRGNIWISLFRVGIDILNPTSGENKKLHFNPTNILTISNPKVRSIIQVEENKFWLGTEGNGIDVITVDENYKIVEKEVFQNEWDDPNSLSHNVVSHMHIARDGKIWITTFGGGINIFNPETRSFKRLSTKDGLPSNVALSIEEDNSGNFWVGTSNGLCKIDSEYSIQSFDAADGIQGYEFVKSASYINSEGELFFGGTNGYNKFHPGNIRKNQEIPPVVITGFKLMNGDKVLDEDLPFRETFPENIIELKHSENDFSFQFAVLNYTQPNKNKYAYQLMNYDDDWIIADNGYGINYTNVQPGRYIFRVKGSNNDGIWNDNGDYIELYISQPWYFTTSAFLMYALLASAILIWGRQLTINRERLKNELQWEHMQLTKMQEMSELKSKFFANISHEFRTPLTLILGPLKSLLNGTYKGDMNSQFKLMVRNADRLLRLINQILDLSRLESGSMKLRVSPGDLIKFIKPIAYSFTSHAERQLITYKCKFPDNDIQIYFEADKIEKVVVNLLSNAFKYTPEFGKVDFEIQENDNEVIIQVSDTGIGIPENQIDHVFNRFYQVDNGQQKGSGIGLALTKELVELHKGTISVESKPDEGSLFRIILKKGREHFSEDDIIRSSLSPQEYHISELMGVNNDIKDPESVEESSPITDDSGAEEHPSILVVEDNEDMRSFISEYLFSEYKILEADNGQTALEIARENHPDVIISDIMMSEMNGFELCKRIKGDVRTSHIPVILLTAKASVESTEKGFEVGADYYMTKPFNPKLLELRIKNILRTRDHIRHQLLHVQDMSLEPKNLKIGSKDQDFLNSVVKCVEDNLANSDFGIDHLCKELALSRTQLYRKLKGLVGQSANEFIRSFRLKRAAQLLKTQELTISEVTYQVGFNDLQYFRYCFKEQFGVNPSEYAQTVQ